MTKISLIPLTSKCPPQTVFISGIEIRYANCLRHQCHLLLAELRLRGRAAVRRAARVFLLQDWTTVRFWSFFFSFFCLIPIKQFARPVPYEAWKLFHVLREHTWNVWLITEWMACSKCAAHNLVTQPDRWYRRPPIAALSINGLLVMTTDCP